MRKILVGCITLALLLSGCNLPLISTSEPSPTVDVVATQVVQRLTAAPTATNLPAQTAAATRPASTTAATTAAASATVPATAQTSPTGAASPTPTKTTTPTAIPGDPRSSLGDPNWKETFQKASTWGLESAYDDGHTRVSIEPGKIILKSYDGNGWRGWRMMNLKIQNFYLEATIKPLACTGNDLYGLVFRSTDNFKGLWFSLTCDGHYSLQSGDINGFADVIKAKTSPLITAGANQVNRLGVMAKGDKFSLYVNGKLLEDITSDAFPAAGVFGYFIAGNKTPSFIIESTEIDYWILN
jgi:hypothetical protein